MKYKKAIISAFIAGSAGFVLGYDMGISGGTITNVATHFNLNSAWEGFALSVFIVGAVLGSIFIDGGFLSVRKVIMDIYSSCWPDNSTIIIEKDYKTRLQEEVQRMTKKLPKYVLEQTHGLEHEKVFDVCVELPDGKRFRASGSGLKKAEQEAAKMALDFILNDGFLISST